MPVSRHHRARQALILRKTSAITVRQIVKNARTARHATSAWSSMCSMRRRKGVNRRALQARTSREICVRAVPRIANHAKTVTLVTLAPEKLNLM